jgi:hypothetical protein
MKFLKFVRNIFRTAQNQSGDGVTTRRQAAAAALQQPLEQQQQQQEQEEPFLETTENIADTNENSEVENRETLLENLEESNEGETNEDITANEDDLFHKETLVAENDLVEVYIIKDYFKRQKIFK